MGEGLAELADRVAAPQKMSGSEITYPKTLRSVFFWRWSIL
jgi:hypothetical protein